MASIYPSTVMFCTNNRPPALGHLRTMFFFCFFFNIWRLDLDTRVGHSESELLSTKSKIDQLESDNTGDQVTECLYFAIYVRSTFQRLKTRFGLSKKKKKEMFYYKKKCFHSTNTFCATRWFNVSGFLLTWYFNVCSASTFMSRSGDQSWNQWKWNAQHQV